MQSVTEAPPDVPQADPPQADPPLDYAKLAWWPEIADGSEGEDLVIAFGKGPDSKPTAMLETEEEAKKKKHKVILRGIRGGKKKAANEVPVVEKLLIKVKDLKDPVDAEYEGSKCDAVFGSKSAARKFVRLYYDAHRMLDPIDRENLEKAIEDPNVAAIGHVWPSRSGPIDLKQSMLLLKANRDGPHVLGVSWQRLGDYEPPA